MNVRDNTLSPPAAANSTDPGATATRVEGLQAAVVAACECMVQHADLLAGLQAAVAQLGCLSGHDRAYVWELTDEQTVCVCIAEWDAPGIARISEMVGMTRFAVADFMEVWAPLLAGHAYQSITPLKTSANAALNEAVAKRSDVMVPIFVGDRCWGCIGFDNCTEERRYGPAEIQALRGAAAAVAAAVRRSQSDAQRAHMVQRHQQLMAAVNEASAHLVAQADLDTALRLALDTLRRHTGVDRVFVHRYDKAEHATYPWLESRRQGLPPFTEGFGAGPWPDDAFAEVAHPLREGRVYRSTHAQRSGANASANAVIHSRSDLIVPVLVNGQYCACIGFDDCTQARHWSDTEVSVLQTAASAISAALSRHEAESLVRQSERARLDDLESSNRQLTARDGLLETVTEAARQLLAGKDFDASVTATLALLGSSCQTIRAGLVQDLSADASHPAGRWRLTHEWHLARVPSQMGSTAAEGEHPSQEWVRRSRAGEALVVLLGQNSSSFDEGQAAVNALTILAVPVFVGGHWWGMVAFDDDQPGREWAPHEIAVLRIAASCIGAALERQAAEATRLHQESQRTAEAQALNYLLEGVVQASRALLDERDFNQGLQRWLAFLAQAVDADAAMLRSFDNTPPAGALTSLDQYWARDGSPYQGAPVPATTDFVAWTERLKQGESVWAHRDELQDPASVAFWVASDCYTNLLMPVVCDGRTVGWLGFDWRERRTWQPAYAAALRTAADGVAAALQRQDAVQAMLEEREQRLAVEHARAEDSARHALRAERHSRLLAAVAQSAEELLAARELAPSLDAVLQRIGLVTAADRLALTRIDWTPDDPVLFGRQEITHEWARQGVAPQSDTPHRWIEMRRDDATWPELWAQLRSQGRGLARIADLAEPFRSTQMALGVTWALVYPVEVGGVLRGLLGFDYSTAIEDYDDADLAALQTVASTIADALLRQELEARALAAERARADESARLATLLTHVVSSSRMLIDTELQAFEPALLAWLGGFGQAVGAMRCTFYDVVDFETTGSRTVRMLAEWAQEGTAGSLPVSFAAPAVIDPRGAESLMEKLTSGHAIAFHTEDTVSPMREFLAQQGNATVVAVPLVMDGQPWGCLSFDHAERRDPQPGEFAVLQTAADTLAAILKRNEALRHMLAEREARLAAEQQRSTELARANASLRQSLDALAGVGGEAAFLSQSLVQLQQDLAAQTAYLFCNDGSGRRLRLLGRAEQGRFGAEAAADDPVMFTQGFEMAPALLAELRQHGRLLWRRVDPQTPIGADTPESTRWHLRMGHRANIVHALMVGERQVGLIGMVFDDDLPPSQSKLDLAHTLCQPITLALELARLSRLAQRSSEQTAMLAERSRLAREIHDGIAQSFLAIQMQLDTLEPGVQVQMPVIQALDMARHGLTEARRAVAALRPQGLLNHDLPRGVQRLLAQLAAQGALQCALDSPPAWQCLPPEVEDHLFRIVQEAANNVLKHAQARQLRVELSQAAGEATVLIADDGVGFDPARLPVGHGFGLESMKQRSQLIGGRIDWLSQPGKGTQVLVSWSEPVAPGQPGPAPRAGP